MEPNRRTKRLCEINKMKKSISTPIAAKPNKERQINRATLASKPFEEKPRKACSLNSITSKVIKPSKKDKDDFSFVQVNKVIPLEQDHIRKTTKVFRVKFVD